MGVFQMSARAFSRRTCSAFSLSYLPKYNDDILKRIWFGQKKDGKIVLLFKVNISLDVDGWPGIIELENVTVPSPDRYCINKEQQRERERDGDGERESEMEGERWRERGCADQPYILSWPMVISSDVNELFVAV